MIESTAWLAYRKKIRIDELAEMMAVVLVGPTTIMHELADVAAVTRFMLPGDQNLSVPAGKQVVMKYSHHWCRWVVVDWGDISPPSQPIWRGLTSPG